MDTSSNLGRLYGIGVGPGDPELLTLKAVRIIRQSPVVVVPKKERHSRSYAYSIVTELVDSRRQELLELVFPMKKDLDELMPFWRDAVAAIGARLQRGLNCAFLTEGDPLFYGTFIYVLRIIKQIYPGVVVEVIPGISSMHAAAAKVVLPLVSNEERLAVLPGTAHTDEISKALREFDAVVVLKVHTTMNSLIDLLEELQMVDKAVYVKKCGTPDEEIVRDVRTLRDKKLDYLSLLIVRK